MSYPVETRLMPHDPGPSWFTPSEARNYYGKYARDGVTVHWWGGGEGADQHDHIVDYFLAQAGIKSVNFVVSDIKITKMVEPDNVAFASQSGNPTTVSIEFQPTLSDEGYKRGGWLIHQLEQLYGKKLELWPHSHWFATSCPGTLDINRLRAEADKQGEDMNYPNRGDLVNIHNNEGWPGHEISDADAAYWCNGTNNPHWGNPNDVWTALVLEVANYAKANVKPVDAVVLKPGTYKVS